MSIAQIDFRSIWWSLSLSNKLFLLCFCGVSIYTISLSVYAFLRLRCLRKQTANGKASSERSLGILNRRLANLRQLHLFTLYLFGFCIMFNIPNAFVTLELTKTPPVGHYIQGVAFLCLVDAAIFLGFLLLHSVQWLVAARVDYFARTHDRVSA